MRRIVLALVAMLSGCSFVFVSGPPPQHEQLPYFNCTESRVVPVLDVIFGVLQGANFLLAATASDEKWADNFDGDPPISRSTAIPLYAAATALAVGGAYYGFSRTAACRDAKDRAMLRARGNFGQPQVWPPQGPYAPPPGQGQYPPQAPGQAPGQGPYPPGQAPQQDPYAPPPQGYPPPQQGPYAPPQQGPYAPPPQQPPPPPPANPPPPNAPR